MSISKYVDLEVRYALYGEDGDYIEPFLACAIIVDKLGLGMSLHDIQQFVRDASITLTEEEIKKFLEQKMEEEKPGLKENLKESMKINSMITLTGDSEEVEKKITASLKKIQDMDVASRYHFEPFSLQYLKNYVSRLKEKLTSMFVVWDDLVKNKTDEIDDEAWKRFLDLDFHVNQYDNVYIPDLIRLIDAIIYNFKDLYDTVNKGNQLETYLTFHVSEHDLLKHDIWPSEIYPSTKIQIKDLRYAHDKQFIALSEHQIEQLEIEKENFIEHMIAEDFEEDENDPIKDNSTKGAISLSRK